MKKILNKISIVLSLALAVSSCDFDTELQQNVDTAPMLLRMCRTCQTAQQVLIRPLPIIRSSAIMPLPSATSPADLPMAVRPQDISIPFLTGRCLTPTKRWRASGSTDLKWWMQLCAPSTVPTPYLLPIRI